jgi:hypothetical protein
LYGRKEQAGAMTAQASVMREIETLNTAFIPEVLDFIGYLKEHYKNAERARAAVPETMLLSQKALAEDWDSPEEDRAWAAL